MDTRMPTIITAHLVYILIATAEEDVHPYDPLVMGQFCSALTETDAPI